MRRVPELVSTPGSTVPPGGSHKALSQKNPCLFLVDPTQRVPFATDVAPQQREWVVEAMYDADASFAFTRLPVEVLKMISEVNDGTMTRTEAKKFRRRLMVESTVFVDENTDSYLTSPR